MFWVMFSFDQKVLVPIALVPIPIMQFKVINGIVNKNCKLI